MRGNFAIHHLRASTRAAKLAYDVEHNNHDAPLGAWFDDMLQHVPVSVVMAGAALEASANELIQDILDGSTRLPVSLGTKQLLKKLIGDRSGNSMGKYEEVSLLFDRPPAKGVRYWQDAELLVAFRNYFMHFKPAWEDQKSGPINPLEKKLGQRVPISHVYKTGFHFPYAFMTYGCAKWSVGSVLGFSKVISELLNVTDRFAAFNSNFELP